MPKSILRLSGEVLSLFAIVSLLSIPSSSQTTFGSITGTITDSSGGVIIGASVTVTNEQTGAQRLGSSTGPGVFNVTDLNVGSYTLHVDSPGFTAFERRGLVLSANKIINIDVQLTVAPTETTTVVREATPVIDTESSALANVKTSRDLDQLPMLARQAGDQGIYAYTTLNTGVSVIAGNGGVPVFQGVPSGTGALPTNDGIAVMGYIVGTGPEAPGLEGIEQLNVRTNTAPAEFATAANFTAVSKSGTNEFHGSGFWDYNGNRLNARNFFSPSVPFRVYHDFGGSIGGPIRKNKTFFFGDYEGSREAALRLLLATTPLPAWRTGDFSSVSTPVIDPTTRAAFPNNVIPRERINEVSQKVQDYVYPLPNFGPPGLQAGNFRPQLPGVSAFDIYDHFDVRVDHTLNPKDSIFGRFSYRRMPVEYTDVLPSIGHTTQVYEGRGAVFSYTHVFSPTLVNEFRAGGNYVRNFYAPSLLGSDLISKFGIQGVPATQPIHNVPIFRIDGVTDADMDAADDSYQDLISVNYEATENLSWTHGAHFMKFGLDVIRDYLGGANWSSSMYGAYNFTGVYTGVGYADFLLGLPQTTNLTIPTPRRLIRGTTWGLYAQDAFKVNRRLTLNYGLRWQLPGPYYDRKGTLYNFNPADGQLVIPDEGAGQVSPFFPKNIPIVTASRAGYPASSLMNFDKKNIYPRFGFAYKPLSNDRTVVRGGYGLYANIIYQPLARRMTGGPFSGTETYVNSVTNGVPLFSFPNPFLPSGTTGTQDVRGFNPNIKVPYTQQWNLTVEHQIGEVGLRVSYVGSHSVGLLYRKNLNQPPPSTEPFSPSLVPYGIYRQVIYTENGGSDVYSGLEAAVVKTYGKNFTLNAGWTWGKDLTDTQDVGSFTGPMIQNQFDRRAERGNNGVVLRHRVFGYAVWALPFGPGQRFLSHSSRLVEALFGGWSTAWNFVAQSGLLFTPSFDGFDPSNTNSFGGRPDVIGDPNLSSGRSINQWFNINAFAIPGCPASQPVCQNPDNVGRFGNSGVNTLRGPSLVNLDLALTKYFQLTERIRLQIRANATNVLNHPNFEIPDADISDVGIAGAIFGTVRAQLGQPAPRVVNLMLRLQF